MKYVHTSDETNTEKTRMQKWRKLSRKHSCNKQMVDSPAEQRENRAGKQKTMRRKQEDKGEFLMDNFTSVWKLL